MTQFLFPQMICLNLVCVCVCVCVQVVEGGNGDRDFEDRFLQCFGLVDPAPVPSREPRTASEASAEERRLTLKRQAETSIWYIILYGTIVNHTLSYSIFMLAMFHWPSIFLFLQHEA